MKRTFYFFLFLSSVLLFAVGCSRYANVVNGNSPESWQNPATNWNPDIDALDPKHGPCDPSLTHDVENFYNHLRNKNWEDTYESRWKVFKKVVPEPAYLNTVKQATNWELANYEVLHVTVNDQDDAIIICKFVELPGPITSYSVVDWRKESDGVWRCDAAGPSGIPLFISMQYYKKPDEGN